jgi:hypothetical protein
LVGILRWIVELGRIDIHVYVTLLSSFMMQPCEGHLHEVLIIFAYLKYHSNATMTFYHILVEWNNNDFPEHDWKRFYHDARDEVPPNMPSPRGNTVQINCFTDVDHAGNHATHHSHAGILIFVNRAPIIWFSKAQSTIKSSTFRAEFVATRIAVELVISL